MSTWSLLGCVLSQFLLKFKSEKSCGGSKLSLDWPLSLFATAVHDYTKAVHGACCGSLPFKLQQPGQGRCLAPVVWRHGQMLQRWDNRAVVWFVVVSHQLIVPACLSVSWQNIRTVNWLSRNFYSIFQRELLCNIQNEMHSCGGGWRWHPEMSRMKPQKCCSL